MSDEQRIREKAYELWEKEGRPEGKDTDHWRQASEDVDRFDKPGNPEAGSVETSVAQPMPKPGAGPDQSRE